MVPRKNGNAPDDGELFERWRRGDEAAGREIVRRYDRRLGGYFHAKDWPDQEIDDLKQETWRRVIQSMATFRGDVPFSIWIFIIARNVHFDAMRNRKREGLSLVDGNEDLQIPEMRSTPDDDSQEKERKALLRKAIGELPPQQRRCLILRVYHELSTKEIAQRLGLSEGAVRAHLFQARKSLRGRLKGVFREYGFPDF